LRPRTCGNTQSCSGVVPVRRVAEACALLTSFADALHPDLRGNVRRLCPNFLQVWSDALFPRFFAPMDRRLLKAKFRAPSESLQIVCQSSKYLM
jgi:hypothetical protein